MVYDHSYYISISVTLNFWCGVEDWQLTKFSPCDTLTEKTIRLLRAWTHLIHLELATSNFMYSRYWIDLYPNSLISNVVPLNFKMEICWTSLTSDFTNCQFFEVKWEFCNKLIIIIIISYLKSFRFQIAYEQQANLSYFGIGYLQFLDFKIKIGSWTHIFHFKLDWILVVLVGSIHMYKVCVHDVIEIYV